MYEHSHRTFSQPSTTKTRRSGDAFLTPLFSSRQKSMMLGLRMQQWGMRKREQRLRDLYPFSAQLPSNTESKTSGELQYRDVGSSSNTWTC